MARNQTQQLRADTQLAKAGWVDEGDGTYILGPKPFNSELSEQVLYKVDKITGDTEVYKVSNATSERNILASINATTGKITSNKENFATFYNNDKAAHKLLIDSVKSETTRNIVNIVEPETAVRLANTTSSPFKAGLLSIDVNEEESIPQNATNAFDVIDLTQVANVADDAGDANDGGGILPEGDDSGDANDGGGSLPETQPSTSQDTQNPASNRDVDASDTPTTRSERAANLSRSQNGVASAAFGGGSGSLQYPERMNGDRIRFQIKDYQKSGLGDNAGYGLGQATRRPAPTLGTIYLPIQRGYADTLACNWGEGEINPLTALAASASYETIATTGSQGIVAGMQKGASMLMAGAETILGESGNAELKQMIAAKFAGEAVGMQGFLSRTAGAAINNNLELLFQGPTLRSFNFQFRLTPRNDRETRSIRKIIRAFKINMVPEASPSNLFLLAPRIFDITYMTTVGGGGLHPYMNRIKRCALKDFSVNYGPDGQYMTYNDAGMTAYELSMTFAELDPVLANDYKGIDATDEGMGY